MDRELMKKTFNVETDEELDKVLAEIDASVPPLPPEERARRDAEISAADRELLAGIIDVKPHEQGRAQAWHLPVRAVVLDKHPLEGLAPFREGIAGEQVKPKNGARVLYWHDEATRGVYLARNGKWERADEPLSATSIWTVEDEERLRFFAEMLDGQLKQLRIISLDTPVQVAPLLSLTEATVMVVE